MIDSDLIDRIASQIADQPDSVELLERLHGSVADANRPLVVGVFGTSGTGKTSIVNAIAGDVVGDVGPMRPTTRTVTSWGSESPRLDAHHIDADSAFILVDTPPFDHDPETARDVMLHCDVALVVSSRNRYADGSTKAVLTEAARLGVVPLFAVNRLSPDIAGEVARDAAEKTGMAVVAISERDDTLDVSRLIEQLEILASNTAVVRIDRASAVAEQAATDLRAMAGQLRERAATRRSVVGRVDKAFTSAAVDRDELKPLIDRRREDVLDVIVSLLNRSGAEAFSGSRDALRDADFTAPLVNVERLVAADRASIARWFDETAVSAAAALRPRWLARWSREAAMDTLWRAALDDRTVPARRVRMQARSRWRTSRDTASDALDGRLSSRLDARRRLVESVLGSDVPDPDRVEALAVELTELARGSA